MAYTNDTKPSGSYSNDGNLGIVAWSDPLVAWNASLSAWDGTPSYSTDTKPSGSYSNDSKPT